MEGAQPTRPWVYSLLSMSMAPAFVQDRGFSSLKQPPAPSPAPDLSASSQFSVLPRSIFQKLNADHITPPPTPPPPFRITGMKSRAHLCLLRPYTVWSQILWHSRFQTWHETSCSLISGIWYMMLFPFKTLLPLFPPPPPVPHGLTAMHPSHPIWEVTSLRKSIVTPWTACAWGPPSDVRARCPVPSLIIQQSNHTLRNWLTPLNIKLCEDSDLVCYCIPSA